MDKGTALYGGIFLPTQAYEKAMSDEDSERFKEILEIKIEEVTERMLFKLEESRKNSMVAIKDLEQTKERLLSFAEYAKDAQPEVLVTLIQTIVERIYIVDKDDERFCHISIKGCTDEDYTGFFQTAGYIEQNTTPVCDSEQYCICTKVPAESILPRETRSRRKNPEETVRMEGSTDCRSGSLSGSHSYAGGNTSQNRSIKFHGVSERKEQYDVV